MGGHICSSRPQFLALPDSQVRGGDLRRHAQTALHPPGPSTGWLTVNRRVSGSSPDGGAGPACLLDRGGSHGPGHKSPHLWCGEQPSAEAQSGRCRAGDAWCHGDRESATRRPRTCDMISANPRRQQQDLMPGRVACPSAHRLRRDACCPDSRTSWSSRPSPTHRSRSSKAPKDAATSSGTRSPELHDSASMPSASKVHDEEPHKSEDAELNRRGYRSRRNDPAAWDSGPRVPPSGWSTSSAHAVPLIDCHGHGGAGVTFSWGYAEAVVQLLQAPSPPPGGTASRR